jgi:hypothetical protein
MVAVETQQGGHSLRDRKECLSIKTQNSVRYRHKNQKTTTHHLIVNDKSLWYLCGLVELSLLAEGNFVGWDPGSGAGLGFQGARDSDYRLCHHYYSAVPAHRLRAHFAEGDGDVLSLDAASGLREFCIIFCSLAPGRDRKQQ